MNFLLSSLERKYNLLTEALQKLTVESDREVPILVEGKKDLHALRRLGIKGEIFCVKASRNILIDSLDRIQNEELIVLVDFDRDGKRLVSRITTYLELQGVKVNLGFWKELSSLVRRNVKDIEGLPSYLEKLKKHVRQDDFGNKLQVQTPVKRSLQK